MQRKTSIAAVFLFSGFLLYQGFAPSLQAQMASIALSGLASGSTCQPAGRVSIHV